MRTQADCPAVDARHGVRDGALGAVPDVQAPSGPIPVSTVQRHTPPVRTNQRRRGRSTEDRNRCFGAAASPGRPAWLAHAFVVTAAACPTASNFLARNTSRVQRNERGIVRVTSATDLGSTERGNCWRDCFALEMLAGRLTPTVASKRWPDESTCGIRAAHRSGCQLPGGFLRPEEGGGWAEPEDQP